MKFSRHVLNLIANLRSLPEDPSRSYTRKTQSIDQLLDKGFEYYKLDKPRLEDIIMAHWKDIVGAKNAHRCCPKKIENDNMLIISVPNPTISNEMRFDHQRILKRLKNIPECRNFVGILFRIE